MRILLGHSQCREREWALGEKNKGRRPDVPRPEPLADKGLSSLMLETFHLITVFLTLTQAVRLRLITCERPISGEGLPRLWDRCFS